MSLDDPSVVRTEYASENGLARRIAAYRFAAERLVRELDVPGRAEAQESVDATRTLWPDARPLLALDGPFRARTAPVVLVAER